MNKSLYVVLSVLILINLLSARQIATFKNHIMPDMIELDDTRLYITEGFVVFIYSLKDFTLIKKFGKRGEGPGEFKGKPRLNVQGDQILINSTAKVSFYTKKGILVKEINNIVSGRNFQPLGNRYIGYSSLVDQEGVRYSGIYLYDSAFARIKSVYRYKSIAQSQDGKGWHLFARTYIKPLICGDKIIVAGGVGFVVDIFDEQGQKLLAINRKYQRIRFSDAHQEKVLNLYKTRPSTAPEYDWWKKNIHFPDYFPAIRAVYSADKKIFVRTYREEKEGAEFFIFDIKGRLLKKVFLPIAPSQAKNAYPFMLDSTPFVIKNGKLYQLILDEESETWILDAREIRDFERPAVEKK